MSNMAQVFCSKCGAKLTESLKFCPSCGTAIPGRVQPDSPPTQASDAPLEPTLVVKRGGSKVSILTSAAVLILAAGGAGYWFYATRTDQATNQALTAGGSSAFQSVKCWFEPEQKGFKATATTDEARFVFPLEKKDVWEWNVKNVQRPQSPADYVFRVSVGGPFASMPGVRERDAAFLDASHSIEGQPQSGDLGTLIAAIKVKATRYHITQTAPNTYFFTNTEIGGVSAELLCGKLVLSIRGQQNIHNLLLDQPERVSFFAIQPGKDRVEQDVRVTYDKN